MERCEGDAAVRRILHRLDLIALGVVQLEAELLRLKRTPVKRLDRAKLDLALRIILGHIQNLQIQPVFAEGQILIGLRQHNAAVGVQRKAPRVFLGDVEPIGRFGFFQRIAAGGEILKQQFTGRIMGIAVVNRRAPLLQGEHGACEQVSVRIHLAHNERDRIIGDGVFHIAAGPDRRHAAADCRLQRRHVLVREFRILRQQHIAPLPRRCAQPVSIRSHGLLDHKDHRPFGHLRDLNDAACLSRQGLRRARTEILIQRRHPELRARKEGGRIAARPFAADFQQADARFMRQDGIGAALIGGGDVKGDAFCLRLAAGQAGVIDQGYVLRAHGQRGLRLIGELQRRIVRHVQREALAVLRHGQHIGGGGGGGRGAQLPPDPGVDHPEGAIHIGKHVLAGAHLILQQDHVAVPVQIQTEGIHLDGVFHLPAAGLEELRRLVHHGAVKARGAPAGGQGIAFAVPADGGGVAVVEHNLSGVNGHLIHRIPNRLGLEHRVIGDIDILALILAVARPAAAGDGEGQREGIAAHRDAVRHDDIARRILRLDQEQVLQGPARIAGQHLVVGERVRHRHGNGVAVVAELARADEDLPPDLLHAVAVGGIVVIAAGEGLRRVAVHRADGIVPEGRGVVVVAVRRGLLAPGGEAAVIVGVDPLHQLRALVGVIQPAVVFNPVILTRCVRFIVQIARHVDGLERGGVLLLKDGGHRLHIKVNGEAILAVLAEIMLRMRLEDLIMRALRQRDLLVIAADHLHLNGPLVAVVDGHLADGRLPAGNQIDNIQIAKELKGRLVAVLTGDLPLGQTVRALDHMPLLNDQARVRRHRRLLLARNGAVGKAVAEGIGVDDLIAVLDPLGHIAAVSIDRGGCEVHQLIELDIGTIGIDIQILCGEGKAVAGVVEIDEAGIGEIGQGIQALLVGVPAIEAVDLEGVVAVHQQIHAGEGIDKGGFVVEIPAEIHVPADQRLAFVEEQLAGNGIDLVAAGLGGRLIGGHEGFPLFAHVGRIVVHLDQAGGVGVILRIILCLSRAYGARDVRGHAQLISAGREHLPLGGGEGDRIPAAVDGVGHYGVHPREVGRLGIVGQEAVRGIHTLQRHGAFVRAAEGEGVIHIVHDSEGRERLLDIDRHAEVHIVLLITLVHVGAAVGLGMIGKGVLIDPELVNGHLIPADGGGSGERRPEGCAVFLQLDGIGPLRLGIALKLRQRSLAVHLHPVHKGIGALIEDPIRA